MGSGTLTQMNSVPDLSIQNNRVWAASSELGWEFDLLISLGLWEAIHPEFQKCAIIPIIISQSPREILSSGAFDDCFQTLQKI